jgi:hypothetical protein
MEKRTYKSNEAAKAVKDTLKAMMEDMKLRAWQWMNEHVRRVSNLEETKRLIKRRAGIVEVLWCGSAECGHKLEAETEASVLGTPEDLKEKVKGICVICEKEADAVLRLAVAY